MGPHVRGRDDQSRCVTLGRVLQERVRIWARWTVDRLIVALGTVAFADVPEWRWKRSKV